MAKNDDKKATQRFVDQPGQWRDVTPQKTKQRQDKAWQEFQKMMEGKSNKKK